MGSSKGFALIAALLALFVLTALGILVFTISTQDVRISGRMVCAKKATAGANTGVNVLINNFNPLLLGASAQSKQDIQGGLDADTRYTIATPRIPDDGGPGSINLPGFSMGGPDSYAMTRYLANVQGTNTRCNNIVMFNTGIGFGPVPATTSHDR